MCINFIFALYSRIASNKLKTPKILLSINFFGESIDLSTCVSAAKLKIAKGFFLTLKF